jgi:hypothetical protein
MSAWIGHLCGDFRHSQPAWSALTEGAQEVVLFARNALNRQDIGTSGSVARRRIWTADYSAASSSSPMKPPDCRAQKRA